MTNKEAIERLQKCMRNLELGKIVGAVSKESADERIEAYALAIKTLEEQRPKGKWRRYDEWINGTYIGGFYHFNCPCEDGYYSKWETNFCPNCGAYMMKGEEE